MLYYNQNSKKYVDYHPQYDYNQSFDQLPEYNENIYSIKILVYLLLISVTILITCILFRSNIDTNVLSVSSVIAPTLLKNNSDNTEIKSIPINPFGTAQKKLGGRISYDEYDDKNLLNAKDEEFIKSIDNVIIDGNNFIYKVHEYEGNEGHPTVPEYFSLLEKIIGKLHDELPKKAILFVIKDPETETQTEKVKEYLKCKNIKTGYKKYLTNLLKKYPSVRIIVAYGDDKPRDDFAALWLSDQLGEKTILLSRDRYSDVTKTNKNVENVKFITYGKNANKYNKLLNKPFAYIDRSSRVTLVGYSFSKKHNSAFYNKDVSKKSDASDYVFIVNMKDWEKKNIKIKILK